MKIRMATKYDCKDIYCLINEMEDNTLNYDKFKNIFNKLIDSEVLTILVAEINAKIVGNLNLQIELQLHHTSYVAKVVELAVASSYRNQQIGLKLFNFAIEYAKAKGCEVIDVVSNIKRNDAHRFYQHQGMKISHYGLTKKIG